MANILPKSDYKGAYLAGRHLAKSRILEQRKAKVERNEAFLNNQAKILKNREKKVVKCENSLLAKCGTNFDCSEEFLVLQKALESANGKAIINYLIALKSLNSFEEQVEKKKVVHKKDLEKLKEAEIYVDWTSRLLEKDEEAQDWLNAKLKADEDAMEVDEESADEESDSEEETDGEQE